MRGYIYTGDTSATYNASKWEKLGTSVLQWTLQIMLKNWTVNLGEIKVIKTFSILHQRTGTKTGYTFLCYKKGGTRVK